MKRAQEGILLIAHKLALKNKTLRDYFANHIYDEVIEGIEFEVIPMREFSDLAQYNF